MKSLAPIALALLLCSTALTAGDSIVFLDHFKGKLGEGWKWLRESKENWRIGSDALEVLIQSGNMWGPQNDARNVLLRAVPRGDAPIEISVTVSNAPTHQYEQVDLVWYYDDSNMVKIGEELVDGKLSVVMGREQGDKTRTISITPLDSHMVQLKLLVHNNQIEGLFKTSGAKDWRAVGTCDLPIPSAKPHAQLSLQFYQGDPAVKHWARVTDFEIAR